MKRKTVVIINITIFILELHTYNKISFFNVQNFSLFVLVSFFMNYVPVENIELEFQVNLEFQLALLKIFW